MPKVINASTEIVDIRTLSRLQMMEKAGRICYRTEDKIEEESAPEFIGKIIKNKHGSVTEFAIFTLFIKAPRKIVDEFLKLDNKYLTIDYLGSEEMYVTGTARALREAYQNNNNEIINAIIRILSPDHLEFFGMLPTTAYNSKIGVSLLSLAEVDSLPDDLLKRHRWMMVKYIVNRAVSHELVRHRPCCLAPETEILHFNGEKKTTIEELYNWTKDQRKGRFKLLKVRSMSSSGEIVKGTIKNVYDTGRNQLYKVVTQSGRSIEATENHQFITSTGWKKLGDISVGELLKSNGIDVDLNYVKKRYLVDNVERPIVAAEIGIADSTLGKIIRKYGLQKAKHNYPGREPGYGKVRMHSEEEKKNISNRMKGSNNHNYKGDSCLDGNSRAGRLFSIEGESCTCGRNAIERHHIDKDSKNNNPDNIEFLCISCHKSKHSHKTKVIFDDKILSISKSRIAQTYDIEILEDFHNFVANGIVVHNSWLQESQRYCRYLEDKFGNEVTFIRPVAFPAITNNPAALRIWRDSIISSEKAYFDLLNMEGVSPQAARIVLENSCKTELYQLCNLVEWDIFFGLRDSPRAEPSMHEVVAPLHAKFKIKFPSIFK